MLHQPRALKDWLRAKRDYLVLPPAAKAEHRRDRQGPPEADPGIEPAVDAALGWLGRAQDRSATSDGGVARHYSLVGGWAPSYPETTGYIIPTLLDCARISGNESFRRRAQSMLDWLVSIQLDGGGFQGGMIGQTPVKPVTFNTGQILMGLAAGAKAFDGEPGAAYRQAMHRGADWLVEIQDDDGCWRKGATPFAKPGEKAYETHVAWGLLEAARVAPDKGYGEAALANIRWALTKQQPNGWFADCCLSIPTQPLTHTIGYVLRGVLEGYLFNNDQTLLAAARKTADGVMTGLGADGFLPGRFDADWNGAVDWVCLTGSVQIAHCWLLLYRATGETAYRDAAYAANRFVRRTVSIDGPDETRGGVKGSFPVSGGYGTYEYLNWAAKFFVDANLLEREIRHAEAGREQA